WQLFARGAHAGHVGDAPDELVAARGESFSEVIEDLGAIMRRRPRPPLGGARRGDRIADVLAIALSYLAEAPAFRREHRARIIAIRANLLAADEQFCRPIDRRRVETGTGAGRDRQRR